MSRQRRAESRESRPSTPVPAAGGDTPEAVSSRAEDAKSFGAVFFFCLGALAMKLVAGALPPFFSSAFDLLIYAGVAISVAVAYRRFVRRAIESRRRDRARQQDRGGRS